MPNIEHKAFKVVRATVDLVCSPGWNPTTDEEHALQQVLREIGWVTEPSDRDQDYLASAAVVLKAHNLPRNADLGMLGDVDGAALLALLCNAAAKADPALYIHKAPLLLNAIMQAQQAGMAVWAKPHSFEQGYQVDTCIFIETSLGRMQWHVRKDDPALGGIVEQLPYRDEGWDGTSKQAIARQLAVDWLEQHGYYIVQL